MPRRHGAATAAHAGAGGAHAPPLAAGSHPNDQNQLPHPLLLYVINVCFSSFRCFRVTLQVFHMDVAKVDQDVAYVAMVIHVCLSVCFKYFICFLC